MKKLILIVLCTQLCACPIRYQAEIRNDSENTIGFIWSDLASESTKIESGRSQSIPMHWRTQCLTVVEKGQPFFFGLPERLPRGVQTTGRFDGDIGFALMYDGSRLSFGTDGGHFIPLEIIGSCEAT